MRRWLLGIILLALVSPLAAQDGLNLPAALFVLTAEGRVDRYGLGAEGVRTVTPEESFVLDFGVAPDGVWIAYRTEQALMLRNIDSGEGLVIDGALASVPPLRGQGNTIAWTPSGDAIAVTTLTGGRVYINTEADLESTETFTAVDLPQAPLIQVLWSPDGRYLAGESESDVWWIYRRENNTLILTSAIPSSHGLAWYNDTSVAFAPDEGGLLRMDLSQANAQTALLDDTWTYALPYRQPNGTLLVFGRQKDDPAVPAGFARLVGLPIGDPRVDSLGEVAIDLSSLNWTPGGQLMMALSGGSLALVSPINAQSFPLPIESVAAYDWGPPALPGEDAPTLSSAAFFLAEDDDGVAQVWQLPGDGSPAAPVTAETEAVHSYAPAPDGARVVYASGTRLMVQRLSGGDPVQIAELSGQIDAQPAFSPDSQQIAYVDGGIWIVPASGGDPQQVIADDPTPGFERRFAQPLFADNINALLVQVIHEDVIVPGVLDPNTGEVLEVALEQQALWLRDGRILLYGIADGQRPGGMSIAGTGSLNQPAQFLPDFLSVQSVREIDPNQLRLVLPERTIGPQMLRVAAFDVTTGQLSPVVTGGFMIDASLSPDGKFAGGYAYQTGNEGRGPLTFRNLETGEQVVLARPGEVWDFQWTQP